MGSAFRKGPAGGLVSKLSLFDMRRDSELGVERRRLQVVETQTRLTRYKVDQEAAQAYFDAARYHGAFEAWKDVSARIAEIAVDVDRLVKTGQHSMVEKLLVQDQAEDAALNEAVFTERYSGTLKRLALLVDMREAPIEVASATISGAELNGLGPALESPFLVRAKAERETARAAVSAREAQNYPRVSAMASVGAMDNAILVGKKDYSGGFGVVLPLFEGFGYSSAIKQSKAAVEEKDFDLQSAKLAVDVFDARADEVIGASRIKAQLLERELDTARRAFAEAKRRYLAFEGPLVDVRESVRNLGRIEPQLSDARADWFFNAASKAFIDGAGLP